MAEVLARVQDRLGVAAQEGRRADPVDYQRVRGTGGGRVVTVGLGVDRLVRQTTAVERGEERLEPLGMLVQDADRLRHDALAKRLSIRLGIVAIPETPTSKGRPQFQPVAYPSAV